MNVQNPQPDIFWFSPNKKINYLFFVMIACMVVAALCIVALLILTDKPITTALLHEVSFILVFIAAITALASLGIKNMINKRIGLSGRLLIIEEKNGREAILPIQQCYIVGNLGVLVDDLLFPLGNENKMLSINQHEYQTQLKPALKQMKHMGEWQYYKYRLANMNKNSATFLGLMILISIMALYGYFLFDIKAD